MCSIATSRSLDEKKASNPSCAGSSRAFARPPNRRNGGSRSAECRASPCDSDDQLPSTSSSAVSTSLDFKDVDPDLWAVLEMATDEELQEVYEVLHGRSLFSPLVKTLVADREPASVAVSGRAQIMYKCEQRFRFLAADSLTVLRGSRRPSYREALLALRDRLGVKCASTLPTVDLEVELFLAILQRHTDVVSGLSDPETTEAAASYVMSGDGMADVRDGTSTASSSGAARRLWDAVKAPLRLGAQDVLPAAFKAVSTAALNKASGATLRSLAVRLVGQHARYEAAMAALYAASGRGLAMSAQRAAAVKAAQAGFTRAVARYTAVRGALAAVNPLLYAWLGFDLALLALGTDYARLSRAVFEIAQIRLIRTQGWTDPAVAGAALAGSSNDAGGGEEA